MRLSFNELINLLYDNYYNINYTVKTKTITDDAIKHIDLKNITNKKSYIGHEFNKLKYEQKILFIIEDFNVCIRVYNYNELSKNEIDKIVLRICCMIRSFKDRIEKNDINIYIYLYNCSRIITETYINSPIEFKTVINEYDMFNCVNGYYQEKKNEHKIIVSRAKNYNGLLTHELCHMCKLDFGGYETFDQWDNDKVKYGITTFSRFTEGINNAISSIIHSLFVSLEQGDINNFSLIYACECKYAEELIGNLLHYFKCNKISELRDNGYNQISMIFEYIILRHVYLKYVDELFHFNYEDDNKYDEYYELFMSKLKLEEDKEFKFNKKMILTKKGVKFTRMEYYLF